MDLMHIKYLSNPFIEDKRQNETVITNIAKKLVNILTL